MQQITNAVKHNKWPDKKTLNGFILLSYLLDFMRCPDAWWQSHCRHRARINAIIIFGGFINAPLQLTREVTEKIKLFYLQPTEKFKLRTTHNLSLDKPFISLIQGCRQVAFRVEYLANRNWRRSRGPTVLLLLLFICNEKRTDDRANLRNS